MLHDLHFAELQLFEMEGSRLKISESSSVLIQGWRRVDDVLACTGLSAAYNAVTCPRRVVPAMSSISFLTNLRPILSYCETTTISLHALSLV